jgi:hypothetical protein
MGKQGISKGILWLSTGGGPCSQSFQGIQGAKVDGDPHASFPTIFAAYLASKQITLSETTKFLTATRPRFDIVHILPAVILGRNELATSTEYFKSGTNRYVLNIALGIDAAAPMLGASVHVDDVGLLHVWRWMRRKLRLGGTEAA